MGTCVELSDNEFETFRLTVPRFANSVTLRPSTEQQGSCDVQIKLRTLLFDTINLEFNNIQADELVEKQLPRLFMIRRVQVRVTGFATGDCVWEGGQMCLIFP